MLFDILSRSCIVFRLLVLLCDNLMSLILYALFFFVCFFVLFFVQKVEWTAVEMERFTDESVVE